MSSVLLVVHLMITLALIAVVLLQKSETVGFGASSGGGLFSVRGQANLLTRLTAGLATAFFISSITLAILARSSHESKSLFAVTPPAAPTAPAPQSNPVKPETPKT